MPAQKSKCPDHHPCSPKPLPTHQGPNSNLHWSSTHTPLTPPHAHARHDLILWAGCTCRTRVSGRIGGTRRVDVGVRSACAYRQTDRVSIHPFPSSVLDGTDPSRYLLGGHVSPSPPSPNTSEGCMCMRVNLGSLCVCDTQYVGLAAPHPGASMSPRKR